jgi:MSHA biogenesis protein MshK
MKSRTLLVHLSRLRLLLLALLGLAITLGFCNAKAETLKDPTQPPASLYSDATASDDPKVVSGPVLQSIMIGPQFRSAIINGQKVMLGKKYEQATLISLDEHKAVLRNPDMSTQTLLMDYAIEKKIVSPGASPSAAKRKVTHSSKPIVVSEK